MYMDPEEHESGFRSPMIVWIGTDPDSQQWVSSTVSNCKNRNPKFQCSGSIRIHINLAPGSGYGSVIFMWIRIQIQVIKISDADPDPGVKKCKKNVNFF